MPRTQPSTLRDALVELRDYCNSYFSERLSGRSLPVNFWEVTDDDLYMEVLGFLHLFVMPELVATAGTPRGFVIAYPIMMLEDGYLTDGYTTISNAGPEVLEWAADCYRTIGLSEEAVALSAARVALIENPDDEDAWESAYESIPNPYLDEGVRHDAISAYFCANRHLFTSVD